MAGCGTYVPGIQEPLDDTVVGQRLVQAIVQNVTCEMQDAFVDVIGNDVKEFRTGFRRSRRTAWLDGWGVQMTLNISVVEKSGLAPSVNWLPPSPSDAIFNLDAAIGLSSEATRVEKVGSYYTVGELVARGYCDQKSRPGGLYLMQSDLKLREWLLYNVMLEGTGEIRFPRNANEGPFKQDVLSHELKFEVISNASVTPGWKLSRVAINQSGPFFTAGRTRTHDLLITMGPIDKDIVVPKSPNGPLVVLRRKNAPSSAAANSHLASEIGLAVANAIKTGAR
jgi:hypothetical protein